MPVSPSSQIRAITELIRQPYALDPGSLEYLVEESLRLPEGVVRIVCSALDLEVSPVERENLENFIRRAASQPSVLKALERCAKKKGRCRKTEQTWLRGVLSRGVVGARAGRRDRATPRSSVAAAPGPLPDLPAGGQIASLDLRDLSGSIFEFPRLFDRLGELPGIIGKLEIRLRDFTYSSTLAVLAQWILARGLVNRYEFPECPGLMKGYLENIRFSDALINPEIFVSQDPMDWAVGLTRISTELSTEKVTDKIVDILTTFINP